MKILRNISIKLVRFIIKKQDLWHTDVFPMHSPNIIQESVYTPIKLTYSSESSINNNRLFDYDEIVNQIKERAIRNIANELYKYLEHEVIDKEYGKQHIFTLHLFKKNL